jgi:hypothetical protein
MAIARDDKPCRRIAEPPQTVTPPSWKWPRALTPDARRRATSGLRNCHVPKSILLAMALMLGLGSVVTADEPPGELRSVAQRSGAQASDSAPGDASQASAEGAAQGAPCAGGQCYGRPGVRGHHLLGHHQSQQERTYWTAQRLPWHNGYYDIQYGQPIALVVPPTAEYQSNYGWGVGGTRASRIYHQFGRPFPGYGRAYVGPQGFQPTPAVPSDTLQFGYYYIRGPW